MNRFLLVILSALVLLCCGTAFAQQDHSGKEGEPATTEQTLRSTILLNALADGDQPVIADGKSGLLPEGTASDEFPNQVPEGPDVYTPLWEGLNKLSLSDRQNAIIQLEVPHDLPSALLKQVQQVEGLWNSGEFGQAVARLRNLEKSQEVRNMAVGISWKVPITTPEPKWGTDVVVGARQYVEELCLDFHSGTGNLFAALKYYQDPDWLWSVNISTDGGQTWSETFTWLATYPINDISAAVVSGYLYVGYTADAADVHTSARVRRFSVTDGSFDGTYGWHGVFNHGVVIDEIKIVSNADWYDNRIYYFAILANDSLIHYWDDAQGESWQHMATGIDDADRGLDACGNQDHAEWYLWLSFAAVDNSLHVVRKGAVWEDMVLDSDLRDVTSIGAYQDRILAVYEYTGYDIKYKVSYDGGDGWLAGWVAHAEAGPPFFHEPHVTGRKGGGFAVVYQREWSGEPDTCWFRHRDYGTGAGTAQWSVPQPFNEIDVRTGHPMSVEWIPPFDPGCHAYGSIWVTGGVQMACFDRIDHLPGDANGDGIINVGDVVYIVAYLYKNGPAPSPEATGDANCDGIVNVGDVVYLVSYLYKSGPEPCCP